MVTRSCPRWPAIFLFLKVLPGSWRLPVEPCERWLTDTPWLASRPAKFQRFMAPAKPLPLVVPTTSTFWPTTKCAASSVAPGSSTASSATRNSASFAFGSTFALAKWPLFGLVTFFTLAWPQPSCTAV